MKFGGEVTRGVLNRYLKIPHFSRLGFFSTAILEMAADAIEAKNLDSVKIVVETYRVSPAQRACAYIGACASYPNLARMRQYLSE